MVTLPYTDLRKLKTFNGVKKFVENSKILLANKKTITCETNNFLENKATKIHGYFSLGFNGHPKVSKKKFFRSLQIELFSKKNKSFLPVVTLSYPKQHTDEFVLEEYWKGYTRKNVKLTSKVIKEGNNGIEVFLFENYQVFRIYENKELKYLGYIKDKLLRSFYEVNLNKGKGFAYFPIGNNDEITVSKSAVFYGSWVFSTLLTLVLYFQNPLIIIGILIFSYCSLAINDAINPKRHPVLNIFQAIIYAIVIFFVR